MGRSKFQSYKGVDFVAQASFRVIGDIKLALLWTAMLVVRVLFGSRLT